jgi:hypothetical protein
MGNVTTNKPIFQSLELEQQYLKVDQAVLELWPVPCEWMCRPVLAAADRCLPGQKTTHQTYLSIEDNQGSCC